LTKYPDVSTEEKGRGGEKTLNSFRLSKLCIACWYNGVAAIMAAKKRIYS
jgi:hypothetical protein